MIAAVSLALFGFSGVVLAPWGSLAVDPQGFSAAAYHPDCPHDQVVWVNTRSGVYHLRGERWFGRTKSGRFECEKEALQEGDRETRNGQ